MLVVDGRPYLVASVAELPRDRLAKFDCSRCGPTNRVIRDNVHNRFVCCACDEPVARELARPALSS